jgi:NADH:ubiquinone oxidoreductase subunit
MENENKHCIKAVGFKFIEAVGREGWVQLNSPAMSRGLSSFREKRVVFNEFKTIESLIPDNYNGWIAYTKTDNPHMMRIFTKLGAKPYRIDLEYNNIWFVKNIRSKE